ncbi:hypothetical protein M3Y94_00913200 [Aphelenchoides besseyi]|nr:hypothetical protein M3Y94_00913200 [Aphelenchoides besseyi]KAI6223277.1 hypothetical protein M3Y95_00872600 [Aphelenchoides besseyi]
MAQNTPPSSIVDYLIIVGSLTLLLLCSSSLITISACCIYRRNCKEKPPKDVENNADVDANEEGNENLKNYEGKQKQKGRTNVNDQEDAGNVNFAGGQKPNKNKKEVEIAKIETEYKAKIPGKPNAKKIEESIKGTTMVKKPAENVKVAQPNAGLEPAQVIKPTENASKDLAPRSRASAPSQPTAFRTSPSVATQPSAQPSNSNATTPSVAVQYY